MFENLRADLKRTKADLEVLKAQGVELQNAGPLRKASTWAVISHRFAHWAYGLRIPVARELLLLTARVSDRILQVWTKCSIAPDAKIGPGFVLRSCYGVFVGHTVIGANCTVESGCVIQGRAGDNAVFGAAAKLLADAAIGNNVTIMPGTVVLADMPDGVTVAGVPGRRRLLQAKEPANAR